MVNIVSESDTPATSRGCIMLAAGGTGGHIFPAEALAAALRARGHAVALVTDERFRDYFDLSQDGVFASIPMHFVMAGNLSGNLISKLRGGLRVVFGIMQARRILKQNNARAVVGFGGYPSFPTMVAASTLRIPTIIHEQNAIMGRANSKLLDRVNRIATSYPETQKIPSYCKVKTLFTGNPVRSGIRALHAVPYAAPAEEGVLRVLVTGGSQGANIFSDVVPEAVKQLPEHLRHRLRIDQQCRAEDIERTRAAYQALGMQADLAPFFADMPQRLASAHLVIARAGASTVAELSCAGRPAILVPLPTAMDNHQYMNAQAVEDNDAGWVMVQDGFTPDALAARLESLLRLPHSLQAMAAKMKALGCVEAADNLAALVEDVLAGKRVRPSLSISADSAQNETRTKGEAA